MNAEQLLDQVLINRELIVRRSDDALEHLKMLKKDYPHLMTDEVTIQLELNTSLSEICFNSSYMAAIDNSLAVLDRFKNSACKTPLSLHFKMVGECYAHISEPALAEMYLTEALNTLSTKDKNYKRNKADILHELAVAEDYREPKSEKIKQYLTEALQLLQDGENSVRQANCLMGIGNYYNNTGEVLKALQNYCEATETFEKKYMLIYMANGYSNIGSCYVKLKEFDKAEEYLNKSLELRLRLNALEQVSISYFNLGALYKQKCEFEKAEIFLFKALKIVEELGNKFFVSQINESLVEIEQMKRNEQRN